MSADNWLFITKIDNQYRLSERRGEGDSDGDIEYFESLEKAVRAAGKRMNKPWPDGEYEYGLTLGEL